MPIVPTRTFERENQNITSGAGVFLSFLMKIIEMDIEIAAANDSKTPKIDAVLKGSLLGKSSTF